MIALYSINLHIMGKANVSLLRMDTIYTIIGSVPSYSKYVVCSYRRYHCSCCSFAYYYSGSSVLKLVQHYVQQVLTLK